MVVLALSEYVNKIAPAQVQAKKIIINTIKFPFQKDRKCSFEIKSEATHLAHHGVNTTQGPGKYRTELAI